MTRPKPAIHHPRRPRNETGFIPTQKHAHIRNLLGLSKPSHRRGLVDRIGRHPLPQLRVRGHWRVHDTWKHAVDANALRGVVDGVTARDGRDAGFGTTVRGQAGLAEHSEAGGDVDDGSSLTAMRRDPGVRIRFMVECLCAHNAQGLAAAEPQAAVIDIVLLVEGVDRAVAAGTLEDDDSSAVDCVVEPGEGVLGGGVGGSDAGFGANVAGVELDFEGGVDLVDEGFGFF